MKKWGVRPARWGWRHCSRASGFRNGRHLAERIVSEGREHTYMTRMRREGGVITFEKGRRCFRCGEEEHAERRGDSWGHDGGVEDEGSTNGVA